MPEGEPVTALNLGDVADGTVTVRVGGAEPFDLQVTAGVADVPEQNVAAVLAVFPGAHVVANVSPDSSAGSENTTPSPAPTSEEITA
jgi:hypothetical protein